VITKNEDKGVVKVRFNLDTCAEYLGILYIRERLDPEMQTPFPKNDLRDLDSNNEFRKAFLKVNECSIPDPSQYANMKMHFGSIGTIYLAETMPVGIVEGFRLQVVWAPPSVGTHHPEQIF
jgi:hypothetical protein